MLTWLGSIAITGSIKKVNIKPNIIDEVFMGNVLQANLGQAPARQAAIFAGIPDKIPCTTINKVCSSGMKSIILGVQSILSGDNEIVIAIGGASSGRAHARTGDRYQDMKEMGLKA